MSLSRSVLAPALVLVLLAAVVVGLVVDARAALSVVAGGWGAVLLLGSTPAILGPVATTMPELSLAAAMTFFATKMMFLLAVSALLVSEVLRDSLDLPVLGISVAAASVGWVLLHVRAIMRSRQLLYDLPDESD